MPAINHSVVSRVAHLLKQAEAVLIGAGAGLTAAAGISYLDREKFAEVFPGWAKKGFRMQYELMGYPFRTQREQWGYYKVHLNYVYFQQHANSVYPSLYNMVKDKEHFVMTSNVDGLFYRNGFSRERLYAPQGDYGKIQCTTPCTQKVWDIKPFLDKMDESFDPIEQVLTDDSAVPKCPDCGSDMFIHARIDGSFIDSIHQQEYQNLLNWIHEMREKKILLLDLGSGFSTPALIRYPMERITRIMPDATLVRVNLDHAALPNDLDDKGISIKGDIQAFIDAYPRVSALHRLELFEKSR